MREYIYDMPLVMAAADLVLCRAGASTIAEIAAIAKPAVLVPSPNVVADHQTKNARVLANAGGAVLLPEESSGRSCTRSRLLRRPPAGGHEPRPAGHGGARRGGTNLPDSGPFDGKTGQLNQPSSLPA